MASSLNVIDRSSSEAGVRNITYDITELYAFIDNLGDLCCLVYNGSGAYEPHNKQVPARIHALLLNASSQLYAFLIHRTELFAHLLQWVKDRVYAHLKRMAQ